MVLVEFGNSEGCGVLLLYINKCFTLEKWANLSKYPRSVYRLICMPLDIVQ